jgi:hypothetical protein
MSRDRDAEESTVAAVRQRKCSGRLVNNPKKRAAYRSLSAVDKKAAVDSGMCYYQWVYADRAELFGKTCFLLVGQGAIKRSLPGNPVFAKDDILNQRFFSSYTFDPRHSATPPSGPDL